MKQIHSNDYATKVQNARDLISSGNYKEATEILVKLEFESPNRPESFQTHSFMLLRNKKYPDAAHIADKGLNYNPTDSSLKRNLAEALSHISGEGLRAEHYFAELQREFSDDPKFLSTYADFLVRREHALK